MKKSVSSPDIDDESRSEYMQAGIAKIEGRLARHLIAMRVDMSGHAYAGEKRENSSTIVSKNLFLNLNRKDPLKSVLTRPDSCVALNNGMFWGYKMCFDFGTYFTLGGD